MNNSEINPLCLHTMIGDGMVLQRDANVRVWGWSKPGEKITLRFLNQSYQTTTDINGKWIVVLDKQVAGGPYEMVIEASEEIVLHDILIGDVWLCSGQSNMQLPMERVKDEYAEIVAHFENANIRQFDVPEHFDYHKPCENTEDSKWKPVTHETILEFTAVGLFFAKQLYETEQVPIGLIKAAIGGSPVEAWMSRESLLDFPDIISKADLFCDDQYVKQLFESDADKEKLWYDQLDKADRGLQNGSLPWYSEAFDDTDWKTMQIPSYLSDEGIDENGAFWFRKDVQLPAALAGQPARIFMGRIVDADFVYINGQFVGTTSYQYPPRKYDVPAGLLKEGKNTIAVRVISNRGKGGFITEKPYKLIFSNQTIDLTGLWKYEVGAFAGTLPDKTYYHQIPVGLYNGMFAPVSEYTVKGVIWYQGESNTPRPETYEVLFSRMIKEWRKKLDQGDLPFLYVQLPNYLERENKLAVNKWPLLREAQLNTLKVPNTAMAVVIDVGEWNDLHPLNKQDVGKRLAQAARNVAYSDKTLVAMGPIFHHVEIKGDKAVLSFTNTGSGLISKDGDKLRYFEIADDDGVYQEAEAYIENDQVIVSSANVKEPASVRYAWYDSPKNVNFYNKEGLPASPFRS